jgi:ferredoxin--NADP+ reductase
MPGATGLAPYRDELRRAEFSSTAYVCLPLIMGTYGGATVIDRTDITPELATFKIVPDTPIAFIPGQFVRLALEVGGRLVQRSYSMVSAPHEPYLEFIVELVGEGRLTSLLWNLRDGDRLQVHSDAAGVFGLDRSGSFSRHIMAATITGIAPFISMIRSHAHAQMPSRTQDLQILLLHSASHEAELAPYADEIAANYSDWLIYIPTISRPLENPEWTGEVGKIGDVLRKYTDMLGYDYLNSVAYLCGHPAMIRDAQEILERARFPRAQIRTEKYFSLRAAT